MNVPAQQIAHRMTSHRSLFQSDWKSTTKWCAWAIVLIAAVYRLLTFVPQPLDSSHTLRPYLYRWFAAYLSHSPDANIAKSRWNLGCSCLLLIPAALVLLNYFSVSRPRSRAWQLLCSRTLLFASIALVLFASRFPILLVDQLSPDEGQFLAAAQKLFVDPIFFRAVDCGTSGPFNIFPLMLPAVVGFSPDFASGRVIALLIILASVYILYRTFCLLVDDHQARIAILPAAGAFAVLKNSDFLHYTSEHMSFLLVALAVFLCTKVLLRPARYATCLFGLGLLTAMAFFAKMQAVPIIGAVALVAIACVYRTANATEWWRPVAMFLAGVAPLPVLNAVVCLAAGVWNDFWISYIVTNYRYGQLPAPEHFMEFVLSIQEIRLFSATLVAIVVVHTYHNTRREFANGMSLYLRLCAIGGITALAADYVMRTMAGILTDSYASRFCILALVASMAVMSRKANERTMPMWWFGWATAVVLGASWFATYAPHRVFPHYLLFLVMPLNMAIAWPILAWFKAGESPSANVLEDEPMQPHSSPGLPFVLVFVILTVTCQSVLQAIPISVAFASIQPEIRTAESDFIRSITRVSDQIVVWGWNPGPYLGSGRVAGTRDLNMVNVFHANPAVYTFYRDRFLRDMRRTRPPMFIDASGPTSFGGEGGEFASRKTGGFEVIPEVRSLVESNYVQIAEAHGQRFYMRRDIQPGNVVASHVNQCSAGAMRCFEGSAGSSTADLPPIRMPDHALLELVFTPADEKDRYATVFSNDAGPQEQKGFQFQFVGNDQYQLVVGVGGQWVRSRVLVLPQNLPAALSFEFDGKKITVLYNGVHCEEMQLPARMADSDAPITIGSWIGGQRSIAGKIVLFQIRDMGLGDKAR